MLSVLCATFTHQVCDLQVSEKSRIHGAFCELLWVVMLRLVGRMLHWLNCNFNWVCLAFTPAFSAQVLFETGEASLWHFDCSRGIVETELE